jgi:hypothetical protein
VALVIATIRSAFARRRSPLILRNAGRNGAARIEPVPAWSDVGHHPLQERSSRSIRLFETVSEDAVDEADARFVAGLVAPGSTGVARSSSWPRAKNAI